MGAIEIAGLWRSSAPPEDVFAVLADLETWPRWWPAIQAVEVMDVGADGTVASLTFDTPAPLRPLVVEVEASLSPPQLLTLAPRRGPVAGSGSLEVTAEDDGSVTAYALTLSFRSRLLRPLERILAGATRDSGAERLRQAGDELAALAGGRPGRHEP